MKLTVSGKSQTRNLKTGAVTPAGAAPTIVLKSGTTTGGSVELNGTLPPGWKVFVWHPTPATTLLNSTTGGDFNGITADAGFDAFTGVGAYICPKDRPPPGCNPPAGQANISIDWTLSERRGNANAPPRPGHVRIEVQLSSGSAHPFPDRVP